MDALVDFTQSLPPWLQWAGIMLIAAIPFVESHFAALIGGLVGVPLPVTIAAAAAGNVVSVLLFLFVGDAVRRRMRARRARKAGGQGRAPSARQERFRRLFARFGVPGVGLVGQMVIPNQFTALMMIALGASRRAIALWVTVGIVLWAVVFALLGQAGLTALLR